MRGVFFRGPFRPLSPAGSGVGWREFTREIVGICIWNIYHISSSIGFLYFYYAWKIYIITSLDRGFGGR